eukprot:6028334-Amphidinium_carterae.1
MATKATRVLRVGFQISRKMVPLMGSPSVSPELLGGGSVDEMDFTACHAWDLEAKLAAVSSYMDPSQQRPLLLRQRTWTTRALAQE